MIAWYVFRVPELALKCPNIPMQKKVIFFIVYCILYELNKFGVA